MPVTIEIKKVEPRLYVGIRRPVKRDGLGPIDWLGPPCTLHSCRDIRDVIRDGH